MAPLASGSWPLWNQFVSFGEPLWANPAIQILYPTTWIALLWDPAHAYILFVLSHVFLSAFGLFLFAQRLGISRAGSFVSASLWILSGPFLSFLNVRYAIVPAGYRVPPGWHRLAGEPGVELLENERVLPRAFAPKAVYFARDFPRTANGKILRREITPRLVSLFSPLPR